MFLFAVSLFLPALGGSKRKAQLAAVKFAENAATRSETLADNFAVLPLARRGTEESLQPIAPAQQADQTRTWSMKSDGAGQNVRSLDVVGYANVELKEKPSEPAAGVAVLSVENATKKDQLNRKLNEAASRVEGRAERESLGEKLAETDCQEELLPP